MKQRDADREHEMNALFPRSKRRRAHQPNVKGKSKSAAEGNANTIGHSHDYELPVCIQTAFNFTN